MLTKKQPTRRLDLPHEAGQYVEVRYLSHTALGRAREAATSSSFKALKEMGAEIAGLATQNASQAEIAEARAANAAANTNPLAGFDRNTLLFEGIVGWSYDAPVTRDNIDDLDEETAQYVAEQLVPKPRTEADRLNGSSGSISHLTVVSD